MGAEGRASVFRRQDLTGRGCGGHGQGGYDRGRGNYNQGRNSYDRENGYETAAIGITGVEMMVTVKSSRPAMTIIIIKGVIPQIIELWPHTTEVSQQMLTSVHHKDEEDRPEEDLVEVRTDKDDEDKVRKASERAETGISHG